MTPQAEPLPDRLARAGQWLAEAEAVVVFTGAGISTDSGVPDFRGPDGVWTRRDQGLPPPRWKVRPDQVRPNTGHLALVELQALGKLRLLISQNVDNLHLLSGIEPDRIVELHGNGALMKCLACDRRFTRDEIDWDESRFGKGYRTQQTVGGQPSCACGGRIISSVVNFGDPMPTREVDLAEAASSACQLFIVAGSSLLVSPANGFPEVALEAGARLVIVNRDPTPLDRRAQLVFREGISDVLPAMVREARARLEA